MSPKTFECANCGALVVVGKKVCRECGSDETTGWQSSEQIEYQSLDIPDGYGPESYGVEHHGTGPEGRQGSARARFVRIIALLLAVGMLLLAWMRWL